MTTRPREQRPSIFKGKPIAPLRAKKRVKPPPKNVNKGLAQVDRSAIDDLAERQRARAELREVFDEE